MNEMDIQRAFAKALRNTDISVEPQFYADDTFSMYGGDVKARTPLGKNTSLETSVGGSAGRGYGAAKGAKMPFTPRGSIQFKHEF